MQLSEELLSLTKELISIPSTKDRPQELSRVLEVAAKPVSKYFHTSFSDANIPSLLISNQPNAKNLKILLSAHLDVVDAKPEQFSAFAKDGRLFGRGAIDMKAAAAAEILAFRDVASQVNYPLGLQLVTDEEIGGHNGVQHQANLGYLSDLYICGEYSFLDIGYQSKGVLWLKIITSGSRAHGAYPWKGINAITKLNHELLKINKLYKVPVKEVWKTTCNVSVISGGNSVNQVPDQASASLDIRRIPTDDAKTIISSIKSGFTYPDTRLEIITDEPANTTDYKHPLISKLAETIKFRTHKPVKYIRFHGASDARHYSSVGVTAIDFGPAGEGLHSDSEWVSINSLIDYRRILTDYLLNLK